ncbi:MAG: hypothetical protein IJL25_12160 [Clostridia bacterium]|nr:hypothetical protein [Clostridia bacterium]
MRIKHTLKKALIPLLICALVFPFAQLHAGAATVLLGDLDFSGNIEAADARFALRMAVGLEKSTPDLIRVGDADNDGAVTASDARIILRVSVGLEDLGGKTVEAEPDPNAEKWAKLTCTVPADPAINAGHDTFTFIEYGNGDGVGLPQQGAIMMGEAGFTYEEILAYYFPGTRIEKDPDYPDTVYYPDTYNTYAGYFDTEELLARIIYMEIGNESPEAAQKAQGVAVLSLLKYFDFNVRNYYQVGLPSYTGYARLPENVKKAAHEILGEYLVMENDPSKEAVLAAYFDMSAGRTLSAKEGWGGADYPVSVASPWEMNHPRFITTYTCSSEEMREYIMDWDSSVKLSDDPADWLEIVSHDGCIDKDRGYVTEIRIGNKYLKGVAAFNYQVIDLKTPAFRVVYTP